MAFSKSIHFVTVAVYAFVPWAITLFVLSLLQTIPRLLFICLHYVLTIVVFGIVFRSYYHTHPKTRPFITTAHAFSALVVFELVFWQFFSSGSRSYFNYVDWIFPAFLIATVVYLTGIRRT